MNLLIDPFQESNYKDQHLELDFGKNSLNTTCITKSSSLCQKIDSTYKESASEIIPKNAQILNSQQQKLRPNTKQQGFNKKSRCFLKQISKVLKNNKLKNSSKPNPTDQNHSNQNYLTFDTDLSTIRFKPNFSSKAAKTNADIKKIINHDKPTKQPFNFQAFFQKEMTKNEQSFKLRFEERKAPVPKPKNQQKMKTVFISDTKQNGKIDKSDLKNQNYCDKQNFNYFECFKGLNQKYPQSEQPTFKNVFEDCQQISVKDQSRFEIETVKSSRVLSMKQSRRLDLEKKNKMETTQLHRSLKKAMSNLSLKQSNFSQAKRISFKTGRPDPIIVQEQKQEPLNYAQRVQNIHFDKLRSKVMSKMEDYQKIKQIRENEEKEKKSLKKKRTFSAQLKLILTVEGTNLTLNKQENQPNNFKRKDFKHRRPYTAIQRTGLEYDRRQNYGRRESEKQRRQTCLAGVNNSANHYRTYSKNAVREVQELDECKSDRVVRKLREKYDTRPQTARPNKSQVRSSTAKLNKDTRKSQFLQRQYVSINFGKVTKKQIQKEKMKEKLLGLLVEYEQEKIGNENLKQGLDIFEDYCDNIDEGLKNITEQIDQYIKEEG